MTMIHVGHGDKSCSNPGQLRIDQDFTGWLTSDQHFTIGDLDLDQDMTNRLDKSYLKSTLSNLSHVDQAFTNIKPRILGLGYESTLIYIFCLI